ncbi:RNA polymerase III subunit GL b isoform X2 [Anguilla rostrata]|uniref:RNA polymerase III subunit GL b isoform X2 n=1 Tax=Anguilla rostrata TaxID=7938 RepID=UPI0030CC43E3
MAGRGRGRGRGQLSFNMEAVGIGKGENLPPSTLQPTPLFPPMDHKPIPLQTSEEAEYMLALKQELRGAMKSLPFYIRPAAPKKDWKRLPRELRIRVRKPLKEKAPTVPRPSKQTHVDKEEIIRKLETLEKKEEVSSDEEGEKRKKQDEEEQEGEEEYDEEEFEEETDYIMSYFDNGEEFGGDSDDNMDEAIY